MCPLVQSKENQRFPSQPFPSLRNRSSGKPPFPFTGFCSGEKCSVRATAWKKVPLTVRKKCQPPWCRVRKINGLRGSGTYQSTAVPRSWSVCHVVREWRCSEPLCHKDPSKYFQRGRWTRWSEKIEMRVVAVMNLIRENPSITRAAIAKKLEITDSQARTAIDMLKDSGKIHREGSDKGGR